VGADSGLDALEACLEQHGILATMIERATALMEKNCLSLQNAGLEQTKLHAFLRARVERLRKERRCYQAICLLGRLSRALGKKSRPVL
jgi:hypothetical protein